MLIGNRYADHKLYRGIRYYDSLPLTSGDLHEYADILQMKHALLLNNTIGSGTINKPALITTVSGASMSTPSVLLIDGDISMVQTAGEILKVSDINASGISDGYLCVVGWYQSLTHSSTLRAYGGVYNTAIANDIYDDELDMQTSTRYQLRWDTVLVSAHAFDTTEDITITIVNRDSTGAATSGTSTLTCRKSGNIRIALRPSNMTYAVSDIYIVPIIKYNYNNTSFSEIRPVNPIRVAGSGDIIKSATEPIGITEEGTIWYDTNNYKFKFYLEGRGFVSTASDYTLLQYRNVVRLATATNPAANVRVDIGIPSYTPDDILQIIYNGIVLTEGVHYTLHAALGYITLIGFTTEVDDQLTFIATKLVDTSSISSIATEFNTHINTTSTDTLEGHTKLSDTPNATADVNTGIAATPKALYEATTIVDSVTNIRYRLTIANGVLGITEVLE